MKTYYFKEDEWNSTKADYRFMFTVMDNLVLWMLIFMLCESECSPKVPSAYKAWEQQWDFILIKQQKRSSFNTYITQTSIYMHYMIVRGLSIWATPGSYAQGERRRDRGLQESIVLHWAAGKCFNLNGLFSKASAQWILCCSYRIPALSSNSYNIKISRISVSSRPSVFTVFSLSTHCEDGQVCLSSSAFTVLSFFLFSLSLSLCPSSDYNFRLQLAYKIESVKWQKLKNWK